jgi:hypothetical protein
MIHNFAHFNRYAHWYLFPFVVFIEALDSFAVHISAH